MHPKVNYLPAEKENPVYSPCCCELHPHDSFIFVAVLLLAFIIDLFSIISTKQELDLCTDQTAKQIQPTGGINVETGQLFNFLCSEIEGGNNISYSIALMPPIKHRPFP